MMQAFPVDQLVKNSPAKQETLVQFLDWEDPLEEGTATHSSILAWRIPWTEEPGGHWFAKIWTRLKQLSTHTMIFQASKFHLQSGWAFTVVKNDVKTGQIHVSFYFSE